MRQAVTLADSGVIQPLETGGRSPHGYRRVIFLVHGFNNDVRESGASYSTMRRHLDGLLREAGCDERRRRALQELLWEFHWPGYYSRSFESGTSTGRSGSEKGITAAMYFLQVVKARGDVADALARYCTGLGPVEVAFIAHSLGCRVVLETVERLAAVQNNAVKVTGAVFMAGAVPVQYLLPFGRLRDAARAIERRYCFYSYLDAVLMLAFPPGQALAGELAPFATGFAGWPKRVWHGHRHTGFGHGGYWKGAMTVPANEAVASVLSGMFLVAANHVLPANAPPPEGPIEETFLPWSRLQERRLQGADWLEDLCAPTRTTLAR